MENYSTLTGSINIAASAVLDSITVTATEQEQIITPSDVDGYNEITVTAAPLQDKTVTPGASQQEITADSGYYGLGTVTVEAGGGGVDNFNLLLNSNPDNPTSINVEMSDDNEAHICYGVAAAFSVSLPDTITEIADTAFQRTSITSISGNGVETVGDYAFNNAPMLASVDLPDTSTIGVSAFYRTLISTVTMDNLTSAGAAAFGSCSRLETAHFDSLPALSENMFSNCANLTDLYLGYAGVVGIPEEEVEEETELNNPFNGSTDAVISIHVPAAQLSSYQADSDWTAVIAKAAGDDNATITLAGDYA